MKRKQIIAGNWKMNNLKTEGLDLVNRLKVLLTSYSYERDVLLCVPATIVDTIYQSVKEGQIKVGGQDCSTALSGAYTGEISAPMLKDIGASHVILGHSERRVMHKETNEIVKKKAETAIENGLVAIICVGETEAEREAGLTLEINKKQVTDSLPKLTNADNVIVAYEPVWAIGTGKTATTEQVQEVHSYIREIIKENLGETTANNMRIIYGGSMNANNAKELLSLSDVDGGLVGGASLKPDDFMKIIMA